jgi:hypothetical protein
MVLKLSWGNKLRAILLALFLSLLGASAIAAPITLEFTSDVEVSNNTFTTQGYYFAGNPGVAWDPGGNFLGPDGLPGTMNYCPGCDASMTTVSGAAFNLYSLDMWVPLPDPGDDYLTITGNYQGGGQIIANIAISATWAEIVFDPSWSNLISVEFGATSGNGLDGVVMDNITVSTVPVPAAVWLFGSALAGLGWLRRKQTI